MVDGVEVKLIPAEVVIEVVDTWKETDGSVRALTEDERAALEILRRVRDDGEWKDVPNMRTVPRKKLMKEVELITKVWTGCGRACRESPGWTTRCTASPCRTTSSGGRNLQGGHSC